MTARTQLLRAVTKLLRAVTGRDGHKIPILEGCTSARSLRGARGRVDLGAGVLWGAGAAPRARAWALGDKQTVAVPRFATTTTLGSHAYV